MNFAPFNVLEFDGALPSVSIASWLPTSTQPGRSTIYATGTTLASVQVVKTIPRIPDPWRATSARPGPAPRKGAVMREPAGIVSSPPAFAYQVPPAPPSNAGYTIKSVPDPWRGTSTPLYGPQTRPFVLTPFLSWQPTMVQPGRPVLRAAGTDHVKDVWRFPEAVSADKWQATTVQPARTVLRATGTTSVDRLLEVLFADRWQPITVQPVRPVVYARGTESVLVGDPITPDKWVPTTVQASRPIARAVGTDHVFPVLTDDTVAITATCQGRLTLTSGLPVTTSDVTAATTVYWTPYNGAQIALYSGGWALLSFAETSVAVPATTSTPFDVFAYNNAGTLAVETLNWTNGTTRATGLSTQDGVYVKSGDPTRRYLGTGCTTSVSGKCEDSANRRFVWNLYNPVTRRLRTSDATGTWTYASTVVRYANNNSANIIEIVQGMARDSIDVTVYTLVSTGTSSAAGLVGIGEDTGTADSGNMLGVYSIFNAAAGVIAPITAFLTVVPSVGYHFYSWTEHCSAAFTNTFFGGGNLGLQGIWRC